MSYVSHRCQQNMKKQHKEGRIYWYSWFEETVPYASEKLRWKYQEDFGDLKFLTGKEKDKCWY